MGFFINNCFRKMKVLNLLLLTLGNVYCRENSKNELSRGLEELDDPLDTHATTNLENNMGNLKDAFRYIAGTGFGENNKQVRKQLVKIGKQWGERLAAGALVNKGCVNEVTRNMSFDSANFDGCQDGRPSEFIKNDLTLMLKRYLNASNRGCKKNKAKIIKRLDKLENKLNKLHICG